MFSLIIQQTTQKRRTGDLTTRQVCEGAITRCTVICQSKDNELIKLIWSFVLTCIFMQKNVTDLSSAGILRCHDSNQMYGWCLRSVHTSSLHRS